MASSTLENALNPPIDHQETLRQWSALQLSGFIAMTTADRLAAIKAGALQDWTEADRGAAFDLFGGPIPVEPGSTNNPRRAKPFGKPLSPLPRPPWRLPIPRGWLIAAGGWLAIMFVVTGQAFGFF